MPSVLKVLSENIDSEYPQKIFEIGRDFKLDEKGETRIREIEKLAVAITPGNFTELKQILEYSAKMLDIEFKISEVEKEGFIEGRTGKILFEDKEIGYLGEVHPSLLKAFHLKMNLCYLELELEQIFEKLG
jgi:phenylalanyl-tRNA synthetase beta chain